ncbi:MAG: hypothetical protein OXE44_02960 [Nitrospinae bacterium]|nr:hypothetical protein [Nitrospinota bacterium]
MAEFAPVRESAETGVVRTFLADRALYGTSGHTASHPAISLSIEQEAT